MRINLTQLKKIAPAGNLEILKGVVKYFNKYSDQYRVNTYLRAVHFLAQAAQETDQFKVLEEYASGKAYENRQDLGNTKPGDGVKFKGRGIFMYTGRYNYTELGKTVGKDLVNQPELLQNDMELAVLSAFIYWNSRKLNPLADMDNVKGITRKINGGDTGLTDRKIYLQRAKEALESENFYDIREIQQQLVDLGYVEVGAVDGIRGPKTDSAIVAFKVDQTNLDANNEITKEFLEALTNGKQRQLEERKNVTANDLKEKGSETIKGVDNATSGAVAIGTGVAVVAAEKTDALDSIEFIQPAIDLIVNHGWIAVALIVVWIQFQLIKIRKARVADHQTGNTSVVGYSSKVKKNDLINKLGGIFDRINPFN